ncbi:PAS domain S-box-containing protein [Halarsenatibacter silvermanii]|uniref:PAS domain S-box-containing protein n=2 Tax=Halarsenatibacter silvermanii TaxID=321763 RepID=A0A1G9R382_9FIRM|nr:PAS domain S-box-containing protein [Halarsenatibacter silvermanii]
MTYIDFCKRFFQHALNGYAIHRMIFSPEGEPIDYKFLEVNEAFEKLTGLKQEDVIGKNVKDALPSRELVLELTLSPAHPEPGTLFFGQGLNLSFEKFRVSFCFISSSHYCHDSDLMGYLPAEDRKILN